MKQSKLGMTKENYAKKWKYLELLKCNPVTVLPIKKTAVAKDLKPWEKQKQNHEWYVKMVLRNKEHKLISKSLLHLP